MRNDRERLFEQQEVDLFQLIEVVWQRKLLVILTMLIVAGVATAYALLATPVYETRAVVLPPYKSDIAALNIGRGKQSGLQPYTTQEIYEAYVRTLRSDSLRRDFFRANYLPALTGEQRQASQDVLFERFTRLVNVSEAGRQHPGHYLVTVALDDAEQSAEWARRYMSMAAKLTSETLATEALSEISLISRNIEELIEQSLATAKSEREDRVARLEEALEVARSIGLENPPLITSGVTRQVSGGMSGTLLYMRGTQALKAEVAILKARNSDAAFVPKLRERQESLEFYRSIQIHQGSFAVYREDGALRVPDSPIEPRKSLFIFGGIALGFLLGVGLALLANLVVFKRDRSATSAFAKHV